MLRLCMLVAVLAAVLVSPVRASLPPGLAAASAGAQTALEAQTGVVPVRLRIAAIKLDEKLLPVGLDPQRRPVVPRHNVGWYNLSARPGQGENVVMWGHVLRWKDTPRVPAPFAQMDKLQVGAKITVETSDGRVHQYAVKRKVWARPKEVAYILPAGAERLTLVSCIGDNVILRGQLTKEFRLITIAEPIR